MHQISSYISLIISFQMCTEPTGIGEKVSCTEINSLHSVSSFVTENLVILKVLLIIFDHFSTLLK